MRVYTVGEGLSEGEIINILHARVDDVISKIKNGVV